MYVLFKNLSVSVRALSNTNGQYVFNKKRLDPRSPRVPVDNIEDEEAESHYNSKYRDQTHEEVKLSWYVKFFSVKLWSVQRRFITTS